VAGGMRILFLSAWCPLPADNGSKLRISSLLRELAGQHQVDLLAFAPEPPDIDVLGQLQRICAAVELVPDSPFAGRPLGQLRGLLSTRPRSEVGNYSRAMAAAVERRAGRRYDLVIASQLHMAPYALLVPHTPRLMEEVDLGQLRDQYARQRKPLHRLRYAATWWKARRHVAALLERFAAATVVSGEEQALVQPLAPRHAFVEVVPNGVDVDACVGTFGIPEEDTLVYPGALSYEANLDAVAYFARAILPLIRFERPEVRLRVTGHTTVAQIATLPSVKGIEFTGYLDDVRPTIASSWAEVVPLRKGGGTRLKVLQALALATPVVSTPKGVQGLGLEAGRHVLVADSAHEFAMATVELLGRPELRDRLASAGRRVVRERYDWRGIGRRFNDLVMQVGSHRTSTTSATEDTPKQ
jgi:glycosyltransferase involved in cell wall biosynthesis